MRNLTTDFNLKCPACGQAEELVIDARTLVRVSADGCDPEGDVEWAPDSHCQCEDCDHMGTVADFTVAPSSLPPSGSSIGAPEGELESASKSSICKRVIRAEVAVRAVDEQAAAIDMEAAIGDLIADLGHLADRHRLDFLALARRGISHWKVEQSEPDSTDRVHVTITIDALVSEPTPAK
jgi:hypothetical protein